MRRCAFHWRLRARWGIAEAATGDVYIAQPVPQELGKDGNVAAASIWVDADACPNVIKEILYRAAERTGVQVTLVANQPLNVPRIPSLRTITVASGSDASRSTASRSVAGARYSKGDGFNPALAKLEQQRRPS